MHILTLHCLFWGKVNIRDACLLHIYQLAFYLSIIIKHSTSQVGSMSCLFETVKMQTSFFVQSIDTFLFYKNVICRDAFETVSKNMHTYTIT